SYPNSTLWSIKLIMDIRCPQRSEPRHICIRRVEIQWETDGKLRNQPAFMEDTSNSGMGLRVRCSFPPGAMIEVKVGDEFRWAIVRHCKRSDMEYFIGVQF